MNLSNASIAALLHRYAAVLAVSGVDRFKVKAYRRAGETIERLPDSLSLRVERGEDPRSLPGVGPAIGAAIEEILRTGQLARLSEIQSKLSPEIVELATRPQLDPKRILRVYKKLGIRSLEELAERLKSGEIGATLGDRMEMHVRAGLDSRPRLLLRKADQLATSIEAMLGAANGSAWLSRTGSLRRRQETVGDVSFLASGVGLAQVRRRFAEIGERQSSHQQNRISLRMASGHQAVLDWAPENVRGYALLESTGSAAHLRQLQDYGRGRGITVSAAGLADARIEASEESVLYGALGLPFIEPELREGHGEIEAAITGRLPRLVSIEDLRGDLHTHTTASDGANSIAEMAMAARERGYEYLAISDHSQSLRLTNGLSEKRLLQQIKEIDRLNSELSGITILKSSEVDILEDGSLDYPVRILKELDLTICSIHSHFRLDRQHQTERIMRAMDNPFFNILGHATGRLLLARPGYEIDIERLIAHAKQLGCFFEINSSPSRLDLSDLHARLAKEAAVKIAINTDAHSIAELGYMSGGIDQARRAWLEPTDVVNAIPLSKLRKLLRR